MLHKIVILTAAVMFSAATPASMRAAPKGSSKVIRTDANGAVEGAPKE